MSNPWDDRDALAAEAAEQAHYDAEVDAYLERQNDRADEINERDASGDWERSYWGD